MTQTDPHVTDGAHDAAAREGACVAGNGAAHPEPGVNGQPPAPAPTPATRVEQAEVLADQLARRVSAATAVVGRGLFRFLARVREEAEDVWAEAQNLRKKDKS
jgi:hypothetical protein